jgi:hypothetical protein
MLSSPVYLECHSPRFFSSSPRDLCGLSVGVYPEPSRRALDCSFFVFSGRSDVQRSDVQTLLSPLECALATKRRVSPVFSRNRQHSSPLDATLTSILVSIDSKRLTNNAKSFRCNTYKKHGGRGGRFFSSTFRRWDVQTFRRVFPSPIAAQSLWCHNLQRRENSLRSGETTPPCPVSKITRADIGNCPPTLPIASRAWVQRSNAGIRVCTYKP